ncbi:MAG: GDSL-type esterase/lipase family protein [Deltaproteobacteria bacterium]
MRSLRLVLAPLLCAFAVPAQAAPVIAFGDSWGNQSWPDLQAALSAAGYPTLSVANHAIDGTTALEYATTQSGMITSALQLNPDAEWIYLSIGGNDLFNHYMAGNPGTSVAANDANMRTMLDQIFTERPDIRVVQFGYERTNFVQSAACMTQAEQFFGAGITQAQINQINETELGTVYSAMEASYPNYTYIPLWGTLQAAAGAPVTQNDPTPVQYMADCFHLVSTGYRIVHDEVVANYWDSFTPPTAVFGDDGTDRCVGNTITFTSQSTGNTRVRWFVDGVDSGTNNTLAVNMTTAGNIDVSLSAFNEVWSDTVSQTIVVDPCRDAGFPRDAGTPDAGFRDGGVPDGGFVDAGFRDGGDRDGGGAPRDGGDVVRDGGDRDGGDVVRDGGEVVRDGGTVSPGRDAGFTGPGRDGGSTTTPSIGGDSWELGGGCSSSGGDATLWSLLVLLGLGLSRASALRSVRASAPRRST